MITRGAQWRLFQNYLILQALSGGTCRLLLLDNGGNELFTEGQLGRFHELWVLMVRSDIRVCGGQIGEI